MVQIQPIRLELSLAYSSHPTSINIFPFDSFWRAAIQMPPFDCEEHCQAPDEFYSGAPWVYQPENEELYIRAGIKNLRQALSSDDHSVK